MRKGKRLRAGGLPRWPAVYISRRNAITITGRHCTIPRYRMIRTILKTIKIAGLLIVIVFCCCLIGKTDYPFSYHMFNPVQRYRLIIDQAAVQYLVDHHFDAAFQYRDYFMAEQRFTKYRLANTVWAAAGGLWLLLFAVLAALNRPFFSGCLFARRTTVRITPQHIVFGRVRFWPRRFRRDEVETIQFKVDAHPRLRKLNPASLPTDVWNLYQQSGRLVMVYGSRIEPIAIIVDAEAAGQFAVCCEAALRRSKEHTLQVTTSVTAVRIQLE